MLFHSRTIGQWLVENGNPHSGDKLWQLFGYIAQVNMTFLFLTLCLIIYRGPHGEAGFFFLLAGVTLFLLILTTDTAFILKNFSAGKIVKMNNVPNAWLAWGFVSASEKGP